MICIVCALYDTSRNITKYIWYLLLSSDGLSEVLVPTICISMYICMYVCVCMYTCTHGLWILLLFFQEKSKSIITAEDNFNSNIHDFSTGFGDTGLCLKMLQAENPSHNSGTRILGHNRPYSIPRR